MIRVMKMMAAATIGLAVVPQAAGAQVLGSDAAACTGGGPAILARIEGLKDRKGNLKLELYPANEEDFLADDGVLERAGKTFRRVQVPTPASARPRSRKAWRARSSRAKCPKCWPRR